MENALLFAITNVLRWIVLRSPKPHASEKQTESLSVRLKTKDHELYFDWQSKDQLSEDNECPQVKISMEQEKCSFQIGKEY